MADDTVAALAVQLDAYAQAWTAYFDDDGAGDAELHRLTPWGERLFEAIAELRATTPEAWALKLRALEFQNSTEEVTPEDRIAEAGSRAEALAWAVVRDLLEDRAQAA